MHKMKDISVTNSNEAGLDTYANAIKEIKRIFLFWKH